MTKLLFHFIFNEQRTPNKIDLRWYVYEKYFFEWLSYSKQACICVRTLSITWDVKGTTSENYNITSSHTILQELISFITTNFVFW